MSDIIVGSTLVGIVVESTKVDSIVNTPETSTVAVPEIYNVVVQVENTSTVASGPAQGPAGPPGVPEDEMVYSKRVDFISEFLIYRGEAAVGASEATAVWRIRKLDIGVDGDVSETWADGNSNFDNAWVDRLALTYS